MGVEKGGVTGGEGGIRGGEGQARDQWSQISNSSSASLPYPPPPPPAVFSSRASGSGYQLFNYFQIVEFRSGLNTSH